MKIHELKCRTQHYNPLISGDKTFETRQNDRDFQVGDCIHMREYEKFITVNDQHMDYTGRSLMLKIHYICDYDQKLNNVILAVRIMDS